MMLSIEAQRIETEKAVRNIAAARLGYPISTWYGLPVILQQRRSFHRAVILAPRQVGRSSLAELLRAIT